MSYETSHGLLVIGQRGDGLARRQVPQLDIQVVACRDDLQVGGLGKHAWTRPGRGPWTRVMSATASVCRWRGPRS